LETVTLIQLKSFVDGFIIVHFQETFGFSLLIVPSCKGLVDVPCRLTG